MKHVTGLLLLTTVFLMGGCSLVEYNSTNSPRMVVSEDRTIFYRHMLLRKGVVVKVLKKEFLYSLVELSNGQKGYVANDALKQAPGVPEKPTSTPAAKTAHKVAKARKTASLASSVGSDPSDALPKPSFRY